MQGVVPWFYRKKGDVDPSTSQIVDICIYDNMVDNAWCKNITQDKIKVRDQCAVGESSWLLACSLLGMRSRCDGAAAQA